MKHGQNDYIIYCSEFFISVRYGTLPVRVIIFVDPYQAIEGPYHRVN